MQLFTHPAKSVFCFRENAQYIDRAPDTQCIIISCRICFSRRRNSKFLLVLLVLERLYDVDKFVTHGPRASGPSFVGRYIAKFQSPCQPCPLLDGNFAERESNSYIYI